GVWEEGWGPVSFDLHFSTILFLLLAVTISYCLELKCKEHEYPFGERCCKDCAPGKKQLDGNTIEM
uniref:Uncharacterized protein n=1 Tax=Strix occidentalis caurina TaxID=311401 RepID=A0A8D0ET02_STROC